MKEQDYTWVKKCIESCTNDWQLETAKSLVFLFIKKYEECSEFESLKTVLESKKSFNNYLKTAS